MRTIGLLGISGSPALARYRRLMDHPGNRDRRSTVKVETVEISNLYAPSATSEWAEVGAQLTRAALQLEASGADMLVLAGSSLHAALPLGAEVSIPLHHMADAVANTLISDGASICGLLGRRLVMEADFISARMRGHGIEIVVPETGRTNLDGIIGEELNSGIVSDASREIYIAAIEQLAAHGAQAVVLASTTLSLLVSDDDSPIPLYDAAALHAQATLAAAMLGTSP